MAHGPLPVPQHISFMTPDDSLDFSSPAVDRADSTSLPHRGVMRMNILRTVRNLLL